MSQLERLLETAAASQPPKPSIEATIKRLAVNKPLRVFIQDIVRMPDRQFQEFAADFKSLFTLAQNDILATTDSGIMEAVLSVPHFAALLRKIAGTV